MQRVLLTICLGAAAAFAPPARTLTSLTALGAMDYEREAALAGVRTMIHDLEGPADPNPVVLAVKAAFDLKKATVYANK